MGEVVFLNGRFLPIKEAEIPASTNGLLYSWGLFETMRSYNNKIIYFGRHLKRLKGSCVSINLKAPYSLSKLKNIIKKTVKMNGFLDAYVRLTLWRPGQGTGILVIVKKYQPFSAIKYRKGFCAMISRLRQNENSFLARMKTTNYLLYQLSFQEAKNKGFDEAIILNNRGYITEASRSNIFLVKDKEIATPSLECGCLEGITRKAILDLAKRYNIKAYEGNFSIQDLFDADEAFLTNSLMGVMPLASVQRESIGKGKCKKLTKFFIEKYSSLLK